MRASAPENILAAARSLFAAAAPAALQLGQDLCNASGASWPSGMVPAPGTTSPCTPSSTGGTLSAGEGCALHRPGAKRSCCSFGKAGWGHALLLYPPQKPTTHFPLKQGFEGHLEISRAAKTFSGLHSASSRAEHWHCAFLTLGCCIH